MKKLLLIILLLSQPIYAHGNDYLFRQEAVEREIAEFEAKLAAELAAQEMMAEIKFKLIKKVELPLYHFSVPIVSSKNEVFYNLIAPI